MTAAHWQVIDFLRACFEEDGMQAQVRAMIWHFAKAGVPSGNTRYLPTIFRRGRPPLRQRAWRFPTQWSMKCLH